MGPDGSIAFGGSTNAAVPGHTNVGSSDAVVGKLTSDGELAWIHQWGSSGGENTRLTSFAEDGSVLAWGLSNGQVPGGSSDNAKGPWAARYSADGQTRAWLKQYKVQPVLMFNNSRAFVDAAGNFNAILGNLIQRITGDGAEIARWAPKGGQGFVPFNTLVPNAERDAIFGWDNLQVSTSVPFAPAFGQQTLDGSISYYRFIEPKRTAVLEPVENVIWTGEYGITTKSYRTIAVTADSVYLAGEFSNVYKNGSVTRPATKPLSIGRYDLHGKRIWFQEIVFAGDSIVNPVIVVDMATDPEGNVVIAATGAKDVLFKLSADDGDLLP